MMDRRKLVWAMAAFTATLAARAQVPGHVYRIGYLGLTSPRYDTPADTRIGNGFVSRLRELGFAEEKLARMSCAIRSNSDSVGRPN